jgi:LysM repeat protein
MEFITDGRYQVQRGDTVQSLSTKLDVPEVDLRKWNRLFGNEVYEGQVFGSMSMSA